MGVRTFHFYPGLSWGSRKTDNEVYGNRAFLFMDNSPYYDRRKLRSVIRGGLYLTSALSNFD